ncbi:hypothetical protein ACPXCE_01480 [Streptomyces sp. DT24]|uniref:hypothetical protein n=1 Tax=unclassified Streptomyces TaxID=2593676 RepID=UPI003CF1572B
MRGLYIDHCCGHAYEEFVISVIRKTLTATAIATVVLAGTTACGAVENLSAGQKLDRAFDKLGEEHSLSLELDLDTDAATLKALDADAEPGEEIPDEAAKLISDARISLSVQSKKPLAESEDKDVVGMAVKFSGPSGDLLEYRTVGDYSYVRADVKAFGTMAGQPVPSADEIPDSAGTFKKLFAGEWVKVATKDLKKIGDEKLDAEAEKEPKTPSGPDAKTQQKLVDALRNTIAREVEFKKSGSKDGVEHVTATAPFRTLLTELFHEIRPLTKSLPPGFELPTDKQLKEVPDEKVTADFTLKNGALTEMGVDMAALAENPKVKKLGLVLRIGRGGKTTAPAGATELKTDELNELIEGAFGGSAMVESEGLEDLEG